MTFAITNQQRLKDNHISYALIWQVWTGLHAELALFTVYYITQLTLFLLGFLGLLRTGEGHIVPPPPP